MIYNLKISYTSQYLQTLTHKELIDLFQQAKQTLNASQFLTFNEKKKVRGDIQIMRMFLKHHTGAGND